MRPIDPMNTTNDFAEYYSGSKFWALVKSAGSKIPFIHDAIAMYYCLIDTHTPGWVKVAITGALGYLILPLDAVPDVLPVIGWLDDAGIIAAAMTVIHSHIMPEHWGKADKVLGRI